MELPSTLVREAQGWKLLFAFANVGNGEVFIFARAYAHRDKREWVLDHHMGTHRFSDFKDLVEELASLTAQYADVISY